MKKFLKDCIFVSLFICLGFVGIEIAFSFVKNGYSYKYNYLCTHKEDISVLILGHSHTEGGVNPQLLADGAFNLAAGSRYIYYDRKIAETWIPHMHNLQCIIFSHGYDMPWGYTNFHYRVSKKSKQTLVYKYYKYMHIPFVERPKDLLYHTALFSDYISNKNFKNVDLGCDSLGFNRRKYIINRYGDWKNINNIHVDSIGADYLRCYVQEYTQHLNSIAKICAENNVRFIVITTPCYETYLAKTNEIGRQTLYNIIDSVRVNYPIEYYNYIADEEFRADTFFYDCSHLNYYGAEKFTLRLKKDLGL